MYRKVILTLSLFFCFTASACDGLDDIVKNLSGANEDDGGGSASDIIPFIQRVFMDSESTDDWGINDFYIINDEAGDANNDEQIGDIDFVGLAHDQNNLYLMINRNDDAGWDNDTEKVSFEFETGGEIVRVWLYPDYVTSRIEVSGTESCDDNGNQARIETVTGNGGRSMIGQVPLGTDVIGCYGGIDSLRGLNVSMRNDDICDDSNPCDALSFSGVNLKLAEAEDYYVYPTGFGSATEIDTVLSDSPDISQYAVTDAFGLGTYSGTLDIRRVFLGSDDALVSVYVGIVLNANSSAGVSALVSQVYDVTFITGNNSATIRAHYNGSDWTESATFSTLGASCTSVGFGSDYEVIDGSTEYGNSEFTVIMSANLNDCLGIDSGADIRTVQVTTTDSSFQIVDQANIRLSRFQ